MAPKRARQAAPAAKLSSKQAALSKKLQTMAERATAHAGLATGPKVMSIHGSGRFFDGVDEVEPELCVTVTRANDYVRREQFVQWVWLAVLERDARRRAMEAEALAKWEKKVAKHPARIADKKWKEACAAYGAGDGPDPGPMPEREEKDLGALFHFCDPDFKAAMEVEPLGSVSDGCAWAVRELAAGKPCHEDRPTRDGKRASWDEILAAWAPLDAEGIVAVAEEWGRRLTWKQAQQAGGAEHFPYGADITLWLLTRGIGRFKGLEVVISREGKAPVGHMLWTRESPDVASNLAAIVSGTGAGATAGSSSNAGGSASGGATEAQLQEIGLALWQLAHTHAWRAILQVAVRQLLTPNHPVHAEMNVGTHGTFLLECPAFTGPAESAALEAIAPFGATAASIIRLQKDSDLSVFSSRLCGILCEHAGFSGHQKSGNLLNMNLGTGALFPEPEPQILLKLAAERPRWSEGLPLKKLHAEVRAGHLLVDGLAALAGHAIDMHAPDTKLDRWETMLGKVKYNKPNVHGDAFQLLRWPICGALVHGIGGVDRFHVTLPSKGLREDRYLRSIRDHDLHRILMDKDSSRYDSVREEPLIAPGKRDGNGDIVGGGVQKLGAQLDEHMQLTLPAAGQLVVNECALALHALRVTPPKVATALNVSRALVELALPRTDVEAFSRLDDPSGTGLRAHFWQHRRPFFLVRQRCPDSVLARLPLDLFELMLKECIGTGFAAALYAW